MRGLQSANSRSLHSARSESLSATAFPKSVDTSAHQRTLSRSPLKVSAHVNTH